MIYRCKIGGAKKHQFLKGPAQQNQQYQGEGMEGQITMRKGSLGYASRPGMLFSTSAKCTFVRPKSSPTDPVH